MTFTIVYEVKQQTVFILKVLCVKFLIKRNLAKIPIKGSAKFLCSLISLIVIFESNTTHF